MAAIVLSRDGKAFVGVNQRKTHPLQAKYTTHPDRICIHAEIDALATAARMGYGPQHLRAIFVARVLKDGSVATAKPCAGCFAAISAFGIKRIEWTNPT